MVNTLTPLISRLRGRVHLANSFTTCHARSWIVAPGGESVDRPAVYDEEDLSRITGVSADDTIEGQLRKVRGGPAQHAPTMAYEVHDAMLVDGHLFSSDAMLQIATSPVPVIATVPTERRAQGVLAATHYGCRYFGHWMRDVLPLTLAARELGPAIAPVADRMPHQPAYEALFDAAPELVGNCRFDRLTVLEDFSQNLYKAERYALLRRRARNQLGLRRHPGVMLLRGQSGARRVLSNELEIAAFVSGKGFKVVDPSRTPVSDVIDACLGAKIVMGVEGSQLNHGVSLMADSGSLLTLQPPSRFVAVQKDRCDCEGKRFAVLVGHQEPGDTFRIDMLALDRMLQWLARDK